MAKLTARFNMALSAREAAVLARLAKQDGVSAAAYVRRLIRDAVDDGDLPRKSGLKKGKVVR
jgi:hypothetical protein